MTEQDRQKIVPYLQIGAGVLFFVAAALARQIGLASVGLMFVGLGAYNWAQARKVSKS